MSKSKPRKAETGLKGFWKRSSTSQKSVLLLSLMVAISMVVSLVIVALPGSLPAEPPVTPTETPLPVQTQAPSFTLSPTQPPATVLPATSATPNPTQPLIGPVLPTHTPTVTPTVTVMPAATATPSAAQTRFTFAVCGDSRDNPAVYAKVLDSVAKSSSLFLIHSGDMVNKGEEWQWKGFAQAMGGFSLPFYPVPGNHDALDGKLDYYLTYSGAPAVHYSLDFGPVHFSFADSHNGGVGASELAWLRQDLDSASQPVKMVILHHPPFDPDGSNHIMAYGNDEFLALMKEESVGYVFAGHIHAYAQQERDGVVYVYTGGAGAPLYTSGHPQAFYHYLLVTVDGEQVTIEVVKV